MMLPNLKPGVSKYWLLALAGLTWSTIGAMLCRRAYGWFAAISWTEAVPLELFGVSLAFLAYRFSFSRIALKNIERLCRLTEKTCLFAFQTWKAYFLVGVMMTLSYFLRRSSIPKPCLAILYTTIGGALLLSSLDYYRLIWQWVVWKRPCER